MAEARGLARTSTPSTRGTHLPRWVMYPVWLADYLSDPRVVHNVPRTLRRARARRSALGSLSAEEREHLRPLVCLSFDVERDVWGPFESSTSATAAPFLKGYLAATSDGSLPATFFVQGEMVADLAPWLREALAAQSLVGLHGYRHELWGGANWVTRRPPVTPDERNRRLQMSLETFERSRLPRPTAFRAPNFTIDRLTYRLIDSHGFTIDSSRASQRGTAEPPYWEGRIRCVPVSCAPLPEPYRHPRLGFVTAVQYRQFNFDTYMSLPEDRLHALVDHTLGAQVAAGVLPHLVMYAHNWEFVDGGPKSVKALVGRTERLLERYAGTAVHMADLADRLFEAPLQRLGGRREAIPS